MAARNNIAAPTIEELEELLGFPLEDAPRAPERYDAAGQVVEAAADLQQLGRFVVNPATGRLVARDGRIGKQVVAAYKAAAIARGDALPVGRIPRVAAPNADVVLTHQHGAYRVLDVRLRGADPQTTGEWAARLAAARRLVPGANDAARDAAFRQIVVTFRNEEGQVARRAVTAKTASAIKKQIEEFSFGNPTHGSDVILEGYAPVVNEFQVGYVAAPNGGHSPLSFKGVSKRAGLPHPHFDLVDLAAKTTQDNCLFAILKAVAAAYGLPKVTAKASTLRERYNIPDGPIAAEKAIIDALAAEFGMRILITTGVEATPDAEKEFDDNPDRASNRNLCVGAQAYPQIIVEGGEENAPECMIYVDNGHYWYVRKLLEPIAICPITGDITDPSSPRSAREIRARVIAQGRDWYGDAQPKVLNGPDKRRVYKNRVIVFDYETVYTSEGRLEPYALGYYVFDPETSGDDFGPVKDAAGARLLFRRENEHWSRLTGTLLDEILAAPDNIHYTLVSFNGCRFDHFLLAAAALERGLLSTSSVFATDAGIRSLRIGRHATLDLAKIVTGTSLDKACEAFSTSPRKVKGFSHLIPQRAAEQGKLQEWLRDNREQLADYLSGDVLSLASLYMKVRAAIRAIKPGVDIAGPEAVQTAGSLAWLLMSSSCAIPNPVSSREVDDEIRGAITGGRVQVYDSVDSKPVTVEGEPLRMVDFVSLYPTVMAAVDRAQECFEDRHGWGLFPSGKLNGDPTRIAGYAGPGIVGVYKVTVKSQPAPNVLPKRGETLDWSFRGEFDTQATHCDIELIREAGGVVEVHSGLVWPVARRDLFRPFILQLAQKKNEQDELKKAKSPDYNPALRELYKLLMNSASGKCAQQNFDDAVELAVGSKAQLAAENRMSRDHPVQWVPIGGEACLLMGKKPAEKVYSRRAAKPSILAVLIYSYSRALLYKTLLQHNCLYSDTDSGVFRCSDYDAIRRSFPGLDPTGRAKELGDLEEELGPHAVARAYFMAPKDYAIFTFDADGKQVAAKLRMKGVNQRSDRLVICPPKMVESLTLIEKADEYNAAVSEKTVSLAADPEQFFRRRAQGETLSVLCSQLTRTFKDGDKPFALEQRFLVKTFNAP